MTFAIKGFATAAYFGFALVGDARMALAQTGEVAGIVRDATAAALPGVTVTLEAGTLAAPVAIETDDRGRFTIRLSAGLYRVTVVAAASNAGPTSWNSGRAGEPWTSHCGPRSRIR